MNKHFKFLILIYSFRNLNNINIRYNLFIYVLFKKKKSLLFFIFFLFNILLIQQ